VLAEEVVKLTRQSSPAKLKLPTPFVCVPHACFRLQLTHLVQLKEVWSRIEQIPRSRWSDSQLLSSASALLQIGTIKELMQLSASAHNAGQLVRF
jgi:hypothetical protein